MRIVTSHTNTDFDALASMVACTCLYPGTIAIHQDLLRIRPRKELDLELVDSLIVVDTNNWKRLDRMEPLSQREALDIIFWPIFSIKKRQVSSFDYFLWHYEFFYQQIQLVGVPS